MPPAARPSANRLSAPRIGLYSVSCLLLAAPGQAHAASDGSDAGLGLVSAIGLAVVTASLLAVVLARLKQPALLAYIIAGLLLSAFAAPLFSHSLHTLEHISHLGLVFLLFIIGLEIDLGGILRLGPRAALAILLDAPIIISIVYGAQWLCAKFDLVIPGLGGTSESWLFFAAAVAFGSTAVVVKLLGDKFDLTSQAGRTTILILIAEDILAVSLLSYLSVDIGEAGAKTSIVASMGMGAVLAVALVLFAKHVLARVLAFLASAPDVLALVAIGWCFLCAESMARIGLSSEMGALIAGMTVRRLPQHTEVMSKVVNLRDFFMALFFVALGMALPPPTMAVFANAAALVGIVFVARLLLTASNMLAGGLGPIVSFAVPINLAQVSEFSLLLVPIGMQTGALTANDASIISYALMLSVVISTYTIKNNYRIAIFFERTLGLSRKKDVPTPSTHKEHKRPADIVLLGYYLNTEALAEEIENMAPELRERILVVDFNLQNHAKIKAKGLRVAYGDISNPETLRHLGIESATLVMSTISNAFLRGITNEQLLDAIRSMSPNARFIATAVSSDECRELVARGADACIAPPAEAAPAYLAAMREALESIDATAPENAGKHIDVIAQ